MKKVYAITITALFFSCMQQKKTANIDKEYGDKIDTSNAIAVADLSAYMNGKSGIDCKIKGTITEVCQREGCWLNMANTEGQPLLVRMKDHGFKVSKDIAGRSIYVQGKAILDTTTVEMLKDYASDAGKSEAEIQAIKSPEIEVVVEANGIVLLNDNDTGKK